MATVVNTPDSFEFVPMDDVSVPTNEVKDDAATVRDPIQVSKGEQQDTISKGDDEKMEQSKADTNGSASTIQPVNINNISIEDMPILILPPNKPVTKKQIILYGCKVCRKAFATNEMLKLHQLKCKSLGCPQCEFSTFDETAFKEHWQGHIDLTQLQEPEPKPKPIERRPRTDSSGRNIDCHQCGKKYRTAIQLKSHLLTCAPTQCKLCDYKSYKSYELRRHFQNRHMNSEDLTRVCIRCNKVFKNKHSLSTHRWICGKVPRAECHDCGYKTFNKYNLRTHILAKHMQQNFVKVQEFVKPIVAQENVKPPVVREFVKPTVVQEYIRPGVVQKYIRVPVAPEKLQSIFLEKKSQRTLVKENLQPANVVDENLQPAAVDENLQPSLVEENLQPTISQENLESAGVTENLQPTVSQEDLQPPTVQENMETSTVEENLQSGTILENLQPDKVQENLEPSVVQENVLPAVVKDVIKKPFLAEKVVPLSINNTELPHAPNQCKLCDRTFDNQRALRAHSIHCKLYKCTQCPFETYRKGSLREHTYDTHKGQKINLSSLPKAILETEALVPIGPQDMISVHSIFDSPIIQDKLNSSVPKLSSPGSQNDSLMEQDDVKPPLPILKPTLRQRNVRSLVPKLSSPLSQNDSPMKQDNVTPPVPKLKPSTRQRNVRSSVPLFSSMIPKDVISSFMEPEEMCTICSEIFENESALQEHALNCRQHKCNKCPYKTHIIADLEHHMVQKHRQNGKLQKQTKKQGRVSCPKCGNHYKNQRVVNTHLRYCGMAQKCNYCMFKSRHADVMERHVLKKHPTTSVPELEDEDEEDDEEEEEEEPITCDKCKQRLKNNETMAFHTFFCPLKPFLDCNRCTFKTRYALCLKNHILRMHCEIDQESYECPKCSGQLTSQETFKKHLISCIPQSVLRCSLCSYMTRDPSCLSDHVLDKHYNPSDTSDIKLIPCPKCGVKVESPQSLRGHLLNCEPQLKCAQCPFKATIRSILDKHVLTKHNAKR